MKENSLLSLYATNSIAQSQLNIFNFLNLIIQHIDYKVRMTLVNSNHCPSTMIGNSFYLTITDRV